MGKVTTTWRITLRVEKDGLFSEYNDTADITAPAVPSQKDVLMMTYGWITEADPRLRGGRPVHGTATRLR
ncbi:hypothetical protein ABT354_05575 [Streptomyces sp. NPDC000594]|uniref:hypothetical protein n=1 Tax=Streptomyces sp. NPDC000594 TaxID=3154261 RepID=UPI003326A7AC